jgi:hypothetical protein
LFKPPALLISVIAKDKPCLIDFPIPLANLVKDAEEPILISFEFSKVCSSSLSFDIKLLACASFSSFSNFVIAKFRFFSIFDKKFLLLIFSFKTL